MTVRALEPAAPPGAVELPELTAALGLFLVATPGRLTSFTHEEQLCRRFFFGSIITLKEFATANALNPWSLDTKFVPTPRKGGS